MSAWALRAMIYSLLIKFNRVTVKEVAQPHCLDVRGALRRERKSVEMPTANKEVGVDQVNSSFQKRKLFEML